MPLQNRVTPTGELIRTAARGTFMGNRGHLHTDAREIRRPWQLKRWITCVLEFKDRHREVMHPGFYTELFFLDEPTSFAAGHRPCAECRRERYTAYRQAWQAAFGGALPSAVEMDEVLHAERLEADGRTQRTHSARLGDLPDGVMVRLSGDDDAYLLREGALHRWTPNGYAGARPAAANQRVQVLTPPASVEVLRHGYRLTPSGDKELGERKP
jgi:hypothetical protein